MDSELLHVGRFGDVGIFRGDPSKEEIDAHNILRAAGRIRSHVYSFDDSKPINEARELFAEKEGHKRREASSTAFFEEARNYYRDALIGVVGYLFNKYGLPRSNILDVGCGTTGENVERLFPPSVDKRSCMQIDLTSAAVAENRRRHPSSDIREGDYLDMSSIDRKFNMITGLSSLDSTFFLEKAVSEIRSKLDKGGYLFHVQDIAPGHTLPIQEMLLSGERPPFVVEVPFGNVISNQLTREDLFYSYYSNTENRYLSVVELFKRRLARAIKNVDGFEIVVDDWFTGNAKRPTNFGGAGIMSSGSLIPLPHGTPLQSVSCAVTLARAI